jgi:hypothetical protein
MYGDDQRLTIETPPEGGTVAVVEVPYRPAPAPADAAETAPVAHER